MYVADAHRKQLLMASKQDGSGLEVLGRDLADISALKVYGPSSQQGEAPGIAFLDPKSRAVVSHQSHFDPISPTTEDFRSPVGDS